MLIVKARMLGIKDTATTEKAKNFMVKVSDLEYSKPYSVISQHDPLTVRVTVLLGVVGH